MRKTLKALFLVLAIILAAGIHQTTYAYFVSTVYGNQDITTASLQIGTWLFVEEWVPAKMYHTGDVVKHNGVKYRALKPNMNKEPDMPGSKKFWIVY